jgi:hypothetical protein
MCGHVNAQARKRRKKSAPRVRIYSVREEDC